jgi:hypothetical protein
MHPRRVLGVTLSLVASEVLFLRKRRCTLVARETRITPGFMIILDMLLELSFFCGSFPNTVIRIVWALLRFCVYLQVLTKILLALRPWRNMSRWSKLQFACSKLFVRLTAARPRAVRLVVHKWSSATLWLDRGIQGSIRSE